MSKILIAEDDQDIRELVVLTLQYNGYDVESAVDGAHAVEKALANKFDLILMDVRMPRMTGYEACKQMKQIPSLKDVPVVFLSAKGQESEVKAGLEAGAEEYLLKPFAPVQLTETIARLVAKHAAAPTTQAEQPAVQPPPAQQAPPAAPPETEPPIPPWERTHPQEPPAQPAPPPPRTPTRRPLTPPSMQPKEEPERKPWEPPSEFPRR
jgi:CheY-like chemotaxis protein